MIVMQPASGDEDLCSCGRGGGGAPKNLGDFASPSGSRSSVCASGVVCVVTVVCLLLFLSLTHICNSIRMIVEPIAFTLDV